MSAPRFPGRLRAPANPVTVTLDGEPIRAERGEPLCAAFVAAGQLTLARSPKFHRPRGPSCLRGACDGCLARVDQAPNVMTCLVGAEDGMEIVTQNRLGSRDADLLRMTDWFFPDGMNHHELFAGVPGVQNVMQAFARRVAGLGRLPGHAAPPRPARRRTADVVVVGSGPAGMATAARLARAGRAVEVLDDQLVTGGALVALAPADAAAFAPLREPFDELARRGAIRVRTSTVAGGVYGRDLLVVGEQGAEVVEAKALVLASGAHDGVLAFEGNDLPGVLSARAAGFLLARGVVVGRRIAIVTPAGGGPFGASFERALDAAAASLEPRARPSVTRVEGEPVRVRGTSRAKGVVVRTRQGERELSADAVLVDAPRSPAYELCEQAGARLRHEPRGYVVVTEDGAAAEGVFATGEVAGVPFEPGALDAHAARVAARVLASA